MPLHDCPVRERSISTRARRDERDAYPDNDSTRLVLGPDLEVGALTDVVEQEVEEEVGFFLLEAYDAAREALIDVQSLLACDGVATNEGVLVCAE